MEVTASFFANGNNSFTYCISKLNNTCLTKTPALSQGFRKLPVKNPY